MGELQARITYKEFELWLQYRAKYGPLNPVRRYDHGAALVASQINNAHGGKARPVDFMPYGKEDEPLSINEFIAATFGNGVKIGKRR